MSNFASMRAHIRRSIPLPLRMVVHETLFRLRRAPGWAASLPGKAFRRRRPVQHGPAVYAGVRQHRKDVLAGLGSPDGDPLDLPSRFSERAGRPLRVLHLGNVANYAYVNAKLMRGAGVECDVVDPDFYHIMATPEWYEAQVNGDHGDDFFPKWSQIDLGGYVRPDWVIQGRTDLVFRLLIARHTGRSEEVSRLREAIEFERRLLANDFPKWQLDALTTPNLLVRIPRGIWRRAQAAWRRHKLAWLPPVVAPQGPDDVADYIRNAPLYRAALDYYDIVQGYTTSAIFAAASGFPRYTAYELGTLRGLPFEDSPQGRLTNWLYRTAPEVFITNVDCVDAARRLDIDESRGHTILHAHDVEGAVEWVARCSIQPDSDPPMILAPARHHWKEGNLSWLKGNDVLIRAAGMLAREGRQFKLVFVNWGMEVRLSKSLIEDEGIADRVEWIGPQSRLGLWPYYMRAVAIADQYKAAAFGGVSLDAMALGRRLVTRFDNEAGRLFFKTDPPIMNVDTPEAVAAALAQCLDDPQDRAGLGARAQAWMREEHGVARQLRDQFGVYERLLTKGGAQIA